MTILVHPIVKIPSLGGMKFTNLFGGFLSTWLWNQFFSQMCKVERKIFKKWLVLAILTLTGQESWQLTIYVHLTPKMHHTKFWKE